MDSTLPVPAPVNICDSHVHLWDPATLSYPWLETVSMLKRPYLPEDFREAHGGFNVGSLVFLECDVQLGQQLAEAQWVSQLAQAEPRITAIVASADLERGEGAGQLVEELAQLPLVKGVRRLIQNDPDINFCTRPDFVRGVQLLEKFDLSFDICIFHPQFPAAISLVEQCPNVRFVLDHIGKPDIKNGVLDPWRGQMRAMASLPNVACKISGMVTEADVAQWTVADLRPYVEHALECFGFDRVMYGGDWPVVLLASEYTRWVDCLNEIVSECSASEKERLFAANATRFYA